MADNQPQLRLVQTDDAQSTVRTCGETQDNARNLQTLWGKVFPQQRGFQHNK